MWTDRHGYRQHGASGTPFIDERIGQWLDEELVPLRIKEKRSYKDHWRNFQVVPWKGPAMAEWFGRRVIVIGAARQGLALARFLAQHGARVVLNDLRQARELTAAQAALADLSDTAYPVEWVCGGHPLDLLDGADLVCLSGGISPMIPLAAEAQARGISLSNDSQIFLELAPCPVIGITGSAGKTTTTTLVGRMAQVAVEAFSEETPYRRVWVGGNIGSPLIGALDEMGADDLAIMELSSFQLELMHSSPQVAAILNITPNHLDRHGTMQAYTDIKARILQFQEASGVAVLGRDDPVAWSLSDQVRGDLLSFGLHEPAPGQSGAFLKEDGLYLRLQGRGLFPPALPHDVSQHDLFLLKRAEIRLRGEHNLQNVLAACAISAAAGLPGEAMRAGVQNFYGVPHRLEYVRTWGGADWYNDSIATAPERAMAAIRSFQEPLVLLAGGKDKDLPWADFVELAARRVDHLIVFGSAADKILRALEAVSEDPKPSVTRCSSLHEAVRAAAEIIDPGDVVLLSPGGTSFDEFKDFEERGECFVQWVNELQ